MDERTFSFAFLPPFRWFVRSSALPPIAASHTTPIVQGGNFPEGASEGRKEGRWEVEEEGKEGKKMRDGGRK
jgi:hypothetical protein